MSSRSDQSVENEYIETPPEQIDILRKLSTNDFRKYSNIRQVIERYLEIHAHDQRERWDELKDKFFNRYNRMRVRTLDWGGCNLKNLHIRPKYLQLFENNAGCRNVAEKQVCVGPLLFGSGS